MKMIRITGTANNSSNGKRSPTRVRSFRASTNSLDRHGTIVNPLGIRTERFDLNPVVVFGHDAYGSMFGGPSIDSILGKVVAHRKTTSSFDVDILFATAEENAKADTALKRGEGGYLSAVSIGFIPITQREEKVAGRMVPVQHEVELLEVSLVPVPSNPEAVHIVRSLLGGSRIARPAKSRVTPSHVAACVRSAFRTAAKSTPARAAASAEDCSRRAADQPARTSTAGHRVCACCGADG
jgi:Caudovirus prohead serine protease